ncbi:MAG: D-alanyl-D-alanine carboxypeptidase/D-alanyl-D-alanine-endopeptidase [Bacteroidota bacterium]
MIRRSPSVLAALVVGLGAGLVALAPAPSEANSLQVEEASATDSLPPLPVTEADRLRALVEEIVADPDLPTAFWGIHIADLTTGEVVLARNEDKLFLPASAMKLLTTATALDVFGSDHRYTTRLYHVGSVTNDGAMRGDLVIRGSGDPTFGSAGVDGDPLQRWAEALAEAGVRSFTGRIIGDDDRFEDAAYAEGWDVTHVGVERYAPPASGLSWRDNLISVRFRDGRPRVDPPGLVEFVEDVSAQRRGGGRLQVSRVLGTNQIRIGGTIPSGYRGTVRFPVENPTLYAVAAFADALRDAGILVNADLADVDDLPDPPSYDGAEPLRAYVSPTMTQIIRRINRRSDNLYAEQVFRSLSSSGSTEAASRRVAQLLARAGAETSGLSIVDGSGLSRKDLVTPESMAALLAHMRTHRHARAFRLSLPQGGGAGSTLRNRLGGVPVRAKTGSLLSVRALAGYVDGPSGQPLSFVLFANHYTARSARITRAFDRIVRALASGERIPADEE